MTDRDRKPQTLVKTPSAPKKRKMAEGKQKAPSGLKSPGSASPSVAISKSPVHPINQKIAMNKGSGLCFHNSDEAKAAMDRAQWHAPKNDGTIPWTAEEQCVIVKQLVDAFKDMTDAKDTDGSAYRQRFTPGDDNHKFYSDWAIEACAWGVLDMAKSIHTVGFKAPIYDKSIIDSIAQTKDWTFKDRIGWICAVLKNSKNVGVTLMKNEKNWTTIGAPHKLYSSTIINSKSNANRATWIIEGREADPKYQGRPGKRQKTVDGAADEDADTMGIANMDNVINMGTGAIETAPKQFKHSKGKKRKLNNSSPPATTSGHNQYIQLAPTKPSPLSEVAAYPMTEAPASASAPSSPLISSENPDAHLLEAIYGVLPAGDNTNQVQVQVQIPAAVGGDDTGDDEKAAVTDDAMDVDDDVKHPIAQAAEEDFSENAIKDITVDEKALDSDSGYDGNDDGGGSPSSKLSPSPEIPDSDDDASNISDHPEDLPDICPAASKTNLHHKGKIDSLEPPLCDAATLEGARALAALGAGLAPVRLMRQV